jgi:hypothetical protein
MRTIWKFPLPFVAYECTIAMPAGAEIVRMEPQFSGPRNGVPTLWAIVDDQAAQERRRFAVIGTGHRLPDEATYIGSYEADPFVWHVVELPLAVPGQVAVLPQDAQNAYRLLVRAGFTQAWDAGAHSWHKPDDEPMTTEQIMAVAVLQEHGFGTVADA